MGIHTRWGTLPWQPLFGFWWAITSVVWQLAARYLILGMGFRGQAIWWSHSRFPGFQARCHGNYFLAFYIWGTHWRHLTNTTEPSVCGGDAALCQITLTTYYYHFTARSELRGVLFWRRQFVVFKFLFVYEISREPLNRFAPNSHGRRIGPSLGRVWRSTSNVKVTRDKNGIFSAIRRPACGLSLLKHI